MTDSPKRPTLTQVMAELKAEYLEKFPQKIELLKILTIDNPDWQRLEDEYHKIKGTGLTYGFPEISVVCEKLETMAQHKETRDLETFKKAIPLLEKMHQSYLENQGFDLQKDAFARSLLAQTQK